MFFNNYSKPGKGVNKRNPDQPRIQIFRDVLPRKLWDLIKLNILYMLTAIPFFIVTMVVVGVVSSPIIQGEGMLAVDALGYDYGCATCVRVAKAKIRK